MPDPIDVQLNDARVATENAQADPELQAGLAARGYEAAQLAEGAALYEAAQAAQDDYAREYAEQYDATDALTEARAAADEVYPDHVELARIAFKRDRAARQALALDGRRRRTTAGWLRQAQQFYTNALADDALQEGLARFKVTPEELAEGRDLVAAVGTADSDQEREKGEAQKAREDRDEALDALDDWMDDFRDVARVAFRDDPQQLEKLGILARS